MANRRYIDFPIASTSGDTDIILIWQDGANKQTTKATFLSGLPENLDELNDVSISGLTNGQILRYDSVTGKWENTDQGNLDLNDLNDVSIVSPSNGQVLVYNSSTSKWENSSAGYVPYTGAVTTVDLGAQQLKAGHTTLTTNGSTETLTINHTSGSGKAINVTKGGAGEGLYVNKTSGSGNAATIVGTLEATTLVKTGGTSSQFLKADGSVDSTTYQNTADKGQPNGYASLDGNGKVPLTQINDALIGNVNFQGLWNASTNTPTLVDPPSSGTKGYYYIVSTGGTFAGITFEVGDWIISNGTAWGKVDNTDAVSSVFGRTGNVVASNGDYNTSQVTESGNLYYTEARVNANTNVAANTAARHNAVTLGTANGLSLSTQQLSLALASGSTTGALSSTDWTTFNNKENAITAGTTAQYFRGDKTFQTLNTAAVPELTNLYYTEARVNANTNVAANTAARHAAVTLGTANGLSLSTQQLSLGLASSGVTGALSGTDWTTFNGKQNALTNPVTGTGTTNYLPKFTGASTIGNSQVFDNGTNVGLNTITPLTVLDIATSANNALGIGNASDTISSGDLIGAISFISRDASVNSSGGVSNIRSYATATYNTGGVSADLRFYVSNSLSNASQDILFGTEAMRIFSDGNLHIGPAPASNNGARLQVSGTATFTGVTIIGAVTSATGKIELNQGTGNPNIEIFGGAGSNSVGGSAYYRLRDQTNSQSSLLQINASGGLDFWFQYGGTFYNRATLASTGAATFSSFVNATNLRVFKSGFRGGLFAYNDITGSGDDHSITVFAESGTNNGNIYFCPNGSATKVMTINTSGNVGIGTPIPTAKLQISSTSAGAATVGLYLNNNSVTLNTETRIAFAAHTNDDISTNRYSYISAINTSGSNGQALIFATNEPGASAEERLRITSDGYVRLSASSGGIQFNGDTAAANALDDYEEGTWTPTVTAQTGTYVMVFGSRGTYTKIGRVVTVQYYFRVVNKGTGSGTCILSNLPFASLTTSTDDSYTGTGIRQGNDLNTLVINQNSSLLNITENTGDPIVQGQWNAGSITYFT
jgi:hypothetical protein